MIVCEGCMCVCGRYGCVHVCGVFGGGEDYGSLCMYVIVFSEDS